MIIRREDQLNDLRNETLFKFGGERVLVELQVQGSSALIKVGVGAQTKDVIIRVVVAALGLHGWNKIILDTHRARGSSTSPSTALLRRLRASPRASLPQ